MHNSFFIGVGAAEWRVELNVTCPVYFPVIETEKNLFLVLVLPLELYL